MAEAATDLREALADRIVGDLTAAMETLSVYLGVELGLYRALSEIGPATEDELATAAGIAPRYAREWLEQQCAAEYLRCDDARRPAPERRYVLPDEHADVLADPDSPYFVAPGAVMVAGIARVLPQLIEAYRTGGGVPYRDYGAEIRRGIASFNRPMFIHELATAWLPGIADVDRRLRAAPGARVLDVGCGLGASAIAIARAYPRVTVLGVDLDPASVADASAAAATAGVADRVTFEISDAARPQLEERFDLVTIFEALHDIGDPVGALRSARASLTAAGSVLVADERVADEFDPPGDGVERLNYGLSILHCLPATLAEDPVEANGTVLRAPTVKRWARDAGFAECEVLPTDNPFWRFYQLRG